MLSSKAARALLKPSLCYALCSNSRTRGNDLQWISSSIASTPATRTCTNSRTDKNGKLLLGRLRPGDTLPSIRDVEKQVGISSRNLVRKAYLELQSWGVLKLRHGKGVIVDVNLQYGEKEGIKQKCETLSRELIARVRKIEACRQRRLRTYLRQQARADELKSPLWCT